MDQPEQAVPYPVEQAQVPLDARVSTRLAGVCVDGVNNAPRSSNFTLHSHDAQQDDGLLHASVQSACLWKGWQSKYRL